MLLQPGFTFKPDSISVAASQSHYGVPPFDCSLFTQREVR